MANFFTGLGQALPQAVGLMTNIQELQERSRHTREMESMEQERLGMLKQNYAAENNLREQQIREAKFKADAMEQEQQQLSKGWDPKVDMMQLGMGPDEMKQRMEWLKGNKLIDPTTELGTQRDRLNAVKLLESNKKEFADFGARRVEGSLRKIEAASAELQKAMQSGNQEKISVAQTNLKQLVSAHEVMTGKYQEGMKIVELNEIKDKLTQSGQWDLLSQKYPTFQAVFQSAYVAKDPGKIIDFLKTVEQESIKASKPDKPPSLGNAAEMAVVMKFGSRDYLTDPKKSAQADAWLGTKEGQEFTSRATALLTPPSVSFQQTAEGITPGITRGPGAGTLGTPTGVGKPLPPAEAAKIGDLNAVLRNIEETEKLYKSEWVGPVMGRVGSIRESYTGGATEEQVKLYAYVRDMKDALLRARSGAQINEQEYARLVKFLPDENLPAKTFKARLKRFKEEVNIVIEEKKKSLSEGGYGKSVGKTKKPLSAFEGK